MGTSTSSENIHRPKAWAKVMLVRTETVVMLRLPEVSSGFSPLISTTCLPLNSPKVLKVGPLPWAA